MTQRKELGIETGYSDISDSDLDDLVQEYREENPTGGCAYIIGRLRAMHSLRIQCQRVIGSMNHIDPLGQGMWQQKKILGRKKSKGDIKYLGQMPYGILMATTSSYYGEL